MNLIDWFVPPDILDNPRKAARHKGIAKSLLAISLVTSLALCGAFLAQDHFPAVELALFAAAILTPIFGALLTRATGDITLGLLVTNIGGILIVSIWAFLTGGINSIALPIFLANLALLSTSGNAALLLTTGAAMMVALVFLFLATSLNWLPASFVLDTEIPALMLTSMLASVGLVVLAGIMMARDRALARTNLRIALQAAEKSGRAKSAFLASMSAELQMPLNTILGSADILATSPNSLDERHGNTVRHILDAGQHLLGLVTQVLEMSRIEDGQLKLNIEPIRTEEIVSASLSIISLEAERKGIALLDDCGIHGDSEVWADRVLAKQVLLNLLSNAVKFSHAGGTVRISCQSAGPEYLRISISDTGVGVAKELQHELFEPFVRLNTDAGTSQGAGLGLAISKQLTERMRGRIGFEPMENLGSTFWVALPLARRTRREVDLNH